MPRSARGLRSRRERWSQIDEVRGGGSYLSSNDQRLHFGLGAAAVMKQVKIEWPSGLTEELQHVAADKLYTIVEGKGITQTTKLNGQWCSLRMRASPRL